MKNRFRKMMMAIVCLVCIGLFACSTDIQELTNGELQDSDRMFFDRFPDINFDSNIDMLAYNIVDHRDAGFNSSVDILVVNNGDSSIQFPAGFGPRLFMFNQEKLSWESIQNLTAYYPEMDIILSQENSPQGTNISFSPDLVPAPLQVRVLINGYILIDGVPTDNKVGAYLDVIKWLRKTGHENGQK